MITPQYLGYFKSPSERTIFDLSESVIQMPITWYALNSIPLQVYMAWCLHTIIIVRILPCLIIIYKADKSARRLHSLPHQQFSRKQGEDMKSWRFCWCLLTVQWWLYSWPEPELRVTLLFELLNKRGLEQRVLLYRQRHVRAKWQAEKSRAAHSDYELQWSRLQSQWRTQTHFYWHWLILSFTLHGCE